MKDNYESIIVHKGDDEMKILLVPYRPEHVERYHARMQRPELLAATASEPLTLAEEYAMQESWYRDANKCTCIVLSMKRLCDLFPEVPSILKEPSDDLWNTWILQHPDFIRQSLDAMIGDVNLFLSDFEDDDDFPSPYKQAEVDIMIAEPWARQQGCATEAVRGMMRYGAEQLGIARYYCKIHESNTASRKLFSETLQFRQCQFAECFQEYEYECLAPSPSSMLQLLQTKSTAHSTKDEDYGTDKSSSPMMIRILPCPLSPNLSVATK